MRDGFNHFSPQSACKTGEKIAQFAVLVCLSATLSAHD
jgi:hypothetical protein